MIDSEGLLIQHEDDRQFPYDDATGKTLKSGDTVIGNITIGIGRNLSGIGLSKSERRMLLKNDIERVQMDLDSKLPWWRSMSQERQLVFVDMCFNLGLAGFLDFKVMLELCREGHYDAASVAGLNSKWATQVGTRATDMMTLLRTGSFQV